MLRRSAAARPVSDFDIARNRSSEHDGGWRREEGSLPLSRSPWRGLVSSTRRIPKLRAESQQIAAWKLLYRVQHPARYVSRLQTIPSSDIELLINPWSTARGRTDVARGIPPPSWRPVRQSGSCDGRRERRPPNKVAFFRAFRLSELLDVSLPPSSRKDTALEAFRHNPTDGSFAPPPARASA